MNEIALIRRVIRVSGAEARAFLQKLLTNDLDRLDRTATIYAGLLTPQGKVFADMFVWRDGDAFLVESANVDLLQRLDAYKLRAAVDIVDLSTECRACFHVERPAPSALTAPDPRLPGYGWRSIGPPTHAIEDRAAHHRHRVQNGVPELAEDTAPSETFALEALFEELNGVDFAKGCFVGQENASRMKRRATTRKKFCRLITEGQAEPGAPVLRGDAEIGTVRAAIHGTALALLRLDRAMATDGLTVGGAPARLDPPDWLILPSPETA